jgi:hypothetical protein
MSDKQLIQRIVQRLLGANVDELTPIELQISKLLVEAGFVRIETNGDLVDTDPVRLAEAQAEIASETMDAEHKESLDAHVDEAEGKNDPTNG